MAIKRLQTRFILSGGLIVLATVACGIWSAIVLFRMSHGMHEALQDSQSTIEAISNLHRTLEREDDAVLLAVSGRAEEARQELARQWGLYDRTYSGLKALLTSPDEQATAARLEQEVSEMRGLGDQAAQGGDTTTLFQLYQERINPALRRAVQTLADLREKHYRAMTQASIDSEQQARQATWVVGGISLVALFLSSITALLLARRVVRPIRAMTKAAEAIGRGEFGKTVESSSNDELGILTARFNLMASDLERIQRLNLDQVLEAKSTLEATLQAIPDAVMLIDPTERVVSTNPAAREVLQLNGRDRGMMLEQLPLPAHCFQTLKEALRGVRSPPPSADLRDAFELGPAGSPQKLLPVVVPVAHPGGGHGAVLVLYDVSEYAKLDSLRMELIGVASHELNTPLTTLRMMLLMLREQQPLLTERQRALVENAVSAVEELGRTAEELLDLARADAGQLHLCLERCDLRHVALTAATRLEQRFLDAGIKLLISDTGAPVICRADAARLSIVVNNLLTNALKYSPAGTRVRVDVSADQGDVGITEACLAVTDEGQGIPERFRERVFDKFFRVEHTGTMNESTLKGSGIGLYLCRHIVAAHGGRIRAECGPAGRGTRVIFWLPGTAGSPLHSASKSAACHPGDREGSQI